jgi:hypothetical protein
MGVMRPDPLTLGLSDADKPVQTPREYFLFVFQIRISQVKREWEQVVAKIQQSIRQYVQVGYLFLALYKRDSSNLDLYSALINEVGAGILK